MFYIHLNVEQMAGCKSTLYFTGTNQYNSPAINDTVTVFPQVIHIDTDELDIGSTSQYSRWSEMIRDLLNSSQTIIVAEQKLY